MKLAASRECENSNSAYKKSEKLISKLCLCRAYIMYIYTDIQEWNKNIASIVLVIND